MHALHWFDLFIVVLYLLGIAAVGAWFARGPRTADGFFLAGRRVPGWVVGFSLIGTIISSVSFVAFPGTAFNDGWHLLIPNLMVPPILLFVMVYVVPFYRQVVRMSSYEYLERRFGVAARLYGSASFLLLRVVDVGFTMLLTSIALEVMTGWNLYLVLAALGTFTLAYSVIGGVEAVIWTDVAQGLILFVGALAVLAVLLFLPEGGPAAVVSAAYADGRFSIGPLTGGVEPGRPPGWLLALAGIIHFGRSYGTEQHMVQRYLVAHSDGDARRGVLVGALGSLVIWVMFFFIGSCLWGFFQVTGETLPREVSTQPDNILPFFIMRYLPVGLVGLLVAAIFAAANSTVSADLNSVATAVTADFFTRARPHASDRARLLFGRAALCLAGLTSMSIAAFLALQRGRALYEVFVTLSMILAGGMLGLFALGFFCRRATRAGAYVAIAITLLFVIWATATGPLGVHLPVRFGWHPLMIGVISNVLLFVVGYLASRWLGGGAEAQASDLLISGAGVRSAGNGGVA